MAAATACTYRYPSRTWLISLGLFEKSYATAVAGAGGAHAYLDPEVFTADTPMGRYQGVTESGQHVANPGVLPGRLGPPGLKPSGSGSTDLTTLQEGRRPIRPRRH